MKMIDIKNCTRELHFPIVQALPTDIEKNFIKRIVTFLTYRRKWKVCEDYCLWVPSLATWIFIPARFLFDGASVPKILNNIYSPTGMLLLGATPHDFGYRYEGLLHINYEGYLYFAPYTKKQLDGIFNTLGSYESEMQLASNIATGILNTFGFLGWKENRKANRILMSDFPELFVDE